MGSCGDCENIWIHVPLHFFSQSKFWKNECLWILILNGPWAALLLLTLCREKSMWCVFWTMRTSFRVTFRLCTTRACGSWCRWWTLVRLFFLFFFFFVVMSLQNYCITKCVTEIFLFFRWGYRFGIGCGLCQSLSYFTTMVRCSRAMIRTQLAFPFPLYYSKLMEIISCKLLKSPLCVGIQRSVVHCWTQK